MKVWSKGLGKTELVMDFEGYEVVRVREDNKELVHIKGMITDPVVWDFRVTITREDMPGLVWTAIRWPFVLMFVKSIFAILAFGFRRVLRRDHTGKEPAR